jgi:bifunctional non-homologous end joining protein LigD
VVAKRRDSRYLPGQRSDSWVKVKHVRHQSAVVGGWKEGQGRRAHGIGSLLLGVPSPEGLVHVGHVGTGFTDADLDAFATLLAPLARPTSPFVVPPRPPAHWVEPVLVVEVAFTEWTPDGKLRQPAYRGVRADLTPEDVVRE